MHSGGGASRPRHSSSMGDSRIDRKRRVPKEAYEDGDMVWKTRGYNDAPIGLELSIGEERREGIEDSEVKEAVFSNEEVQVEFAMPDGSSFSGWFRMGQTVEVLKAEVATRFAVDMTAVELFMDAQPMLDPLSISDHVSSTDEPILVEVFVEAGFSASRHIHK